MTKLLPPSFGPPSTVFGDDSSDKLSTGISLSYPIFRIKGKVFSISRGAGEPIPLMRADGDGPRNSVDVVLLSASQYISKVWYEHGYEEGSTNPPDCFSPNGITPDAGSSKKQSNVCADCTHNKWGSKITPAGKKAKACTDSKRVAVTPLGDIENKAFGGPMLLRVPAASLSDLAEYGDMMETRGYKYYAIGTKISFDPGEAYPKLVFEPVRPLTDEEAMKVIELRKSEVVKAILSEGTDYAAEATVQVTVQPGLPDTFPAKAGNGAAHVTSKVTTPPKGAVHITEAMPPETPRKTPVPPAPSPTDGFGGSEASAAPAPAPSRSPRKPKATVPPPSQTPPHPPENAAAAGDFESALDEQLESLMPSD